MVSRHPRNTLQRALTLWGVLFALCASLLSPIAAYAAPSDTASSDDYVKSWEYATFLRACFNTHGKDNERYSATPANAARFIWFAGNDVDVGYTVPTSDGIKRCGNPGDVEQAVASIGYTADQAGAIKILCGIMEYQAYDSSGKELGVCSQDPATFASYGYVKAKPGGETNILGYRLYNGFFGINDVPPLRDEHKYVGYFNAFIKGPCKAEDQGVFNAQDIAMGSKLNESGYAKVVVAKNGKTEEHLYKYSGGTAVLWTHERTFEAVAAPCSDLPGLIGARAMQYAQANPTNESTTQTGTGSGGSSEEKDKSACGITGVGWIVCPVMSFLSNVMDNTFKFLADSFLSTDPEVFKTGSPTYKAWSIFLSYANVAFVIVFMVIIYSQVTSAGIGNYGIKKMLPKLIVGAVLVNVSYFICQAAIDLSNVVGYSIMGLFDTVTKQVGQGVSLDWQSTIAGILVLGAAAGLLIALGGSFLIAGLFAAATVVLILVARKAIIILLVVISPLAFVAYLLPNTENLFKQWRKMLTGVLLVFPIIALVFGASKLASAIIYNTDPSNSVTRTTALGIAAIPLMVVLPLLKRALESVPMIGSKLQGISNKATGRARSSAKKGAANRVAPLQDAWKYRQQQKDIRRVQRRGGGVRAAVLGRVGGGTYRGKLATQAASLEENEFTEQVKAASAHVGNLATGAAVTRFSGASEAEQAAIIEHVMAKGSFNERRQLVEASGTLTGPNAARLRKRISDGVYSKGDQNIYGSGIGAQITTGTIVSEAALRQATLSNINDGHVAAEHLVQGEGATEYLVDTATGATAAGTATGVGTATDYAAARAQLRTAEAGARTNTGTRSKLNSAYDTTLGRL